MFEDIRYKDCVRLDPEMAEILREIAGASQDNFSQIYDEDMSDDIQDDSVLDDGEDQHCTVDDLISYDVYGEFNIEGEFWETGNNRRADSENDMYIYETWLD